MQRRFEPILAKRLPAFALTRPTLGQAYATKQGPIARQIGLWGQSSRSLYASLAAKLAGHSLFWRHVASAKSDWPYGAPMLRWPLPLPSPDSQENGSPRGYLSCNRTTGATLLPMLENERLTPLLILKLSQSALVNLVTTKA